MHHLFKKKWYLQGSSRQQYSFTQMWMTRILKGRKYEETERQELELLDTRFLIFREFSRGLPVCRTLVCSPNMTEKSAKLRSDDSITWITDYSRYNEIRGEMHCQKVGDLLLYFDNVHKNKLLYRLIIIFSWIIPLLINLVFLKSFIAHISTNYFNDQLAFALI